MLNQPHEIAATKPVFRQVVRECNIGVEPEGHRSSVAMGINVMNFVTPDKCSVTQRLEGQMLTPHVLMK